MTKRCEVVTFMQIGWGEVEGQCGCEGAYRVGDFVFCEGCLVEAIRTRALGSAVVLRLWDELPAVDEAAE